MQRTHNRIWIPFGDKLHSSFFVVALALLFALGGSCAGSDPIYVTGSNHSVGRNSEGSISVAPQAVARLRPRFVNGAMIVDVYPLKGEGYIDIAVRISNQPKAWSKLKKWNRNLRFPQAGRPIPTPLSYLNVDYRVQAVKSLFPKDSYTASGWKHQVSYSGETMWFIAEVFTGDGTNYPELQKANGLDKGTPLALGQNLLIPLAILSDDFTQALPEHPDLAFERGPDGKLYAVYELKRGEALYSAVVVRFTGRIEAEDVNAMADRLLKLNQITDPTKIPVGKKIRIPFDDLSDDFATSGAPDRVVNVERSTRGASLHVILDPGHGGSDPGVTRNGISEDELAYDIMVRLQHKLQQHGANVYPTVTDPDDDGRPKNNARHGNSKNEVINTRPPYPISDSRVGVNLRVYLINSIYQNLRRRGVDDRNIFFISIHMDHLHPSMSGAMVYYPNEDLRNATFRTSGSIYRKFAESRNVKVHFDHHEIRKAESYSYDFSRDLVRAFQSGKIPVHPYRAIRPYVYRRNRKWTPGILRYSKIPTSVLIEVINMSNRDDFARIQEANFRQRVAEAIAAVIL